MCRIERPEEGGPPVLRFSAGMRIIDLHRFRKDWADQPDEILVEMLRRAVPREPGQGITAETPRRRWNDPPVHSAS